MNETTNDVKTGDNLWVKMINMGKTINDVRSGDNLWVAFTIPGSSKWTIQKIDIIEGIEGGWYYIRQDLKTSPIAFMGAHIMFEEHEVRAQYIQKYGMYFCISKDIAEYVVQQKVIKRSDEIVEKIRALVTESAELAESLPKEFDKLFMKVPDKIHLTRIYGVPSN